MNAETILKKLTKRSQPAIQAYDVWLAQGYSLADLTLDLIDLSFEEHRARKTCIDRQRNPEREMSGPDGVFKAWRAYK